MSRLSVFDLYNHCILAILVLVKTSEELFQMDILRFTHIYVSVYISRIADVNKELPLGLFKYIITILFRFSDPLPPFLRIFPCVLILNRVCI